MKILFFIESLRAGGKERRLVELIKRLSDNPSIQMEIVLIKNKLHYNEIYKSNIKIHFTPRNHFKKDPGVFYKFYKIAKTFKPDIIHVWSNLAALYAVPTSYFLKIPMLNNQIGDVPLNRSRSILNEKLTFPFSKKIVSNSFAGLEAYGAPQNKSCVIYNGFDFNRIKNLDSKDIVIQKLKIKSKFIVGMVATFSHLKDYATYIISANEILKIRNDVTFLCIGAGDFSIYEKMVDSTNRDHILFFREQEHIESIMNICDIGVLSTYTEGISNALIEFLALGKPVITTYGGGNIELVKHGITGFLINQKSPNELAERILYLLNNDQVRHDMGSAGIQSIIKDFSIEEMVSKFEQLYDHLLLNENKI